MISIEAPNSASLRPAITSSNTSSRGWPAIAREFEKPLLVQVQIANNILASISQTDECERSACLLERRLFFVVRSPLAKNGAERHILKHRHCGKVAKGLLHHGDAHLSDAMNGTTGDVLIREPDRATGWRLETDDHLE